MRKLFGFYILLLRIISGRNSSWRLRMEENKSLQNSLKAQRNWGSGLSPVVQKSKYRSGRRCRALDEETGKINGQVPLQRYAGDARRVMWNQTFSDLLFEVDPARFVRQVLPVATMYPRINLVTILRVDSKKWNVDERLNTVWSYARLHGYGVSYCIQEEISYLMIPNLDSWIRKQTPYWGGICVFLAARAHPEADWMLYFNDENFVSPKFQKIGLEFYLEQIPDPEEDWAFVTVEGVELLTRLYFVRNSADGLAIQLAWILENHTRVFIDQSSRIMEIYSLMSVFVNLMDVKRGWPVHHRVRSMIGKVRNMYWLHHYSFHDYILALLDWEYDMVPELSYVDREKTKPFFFLKRAENIVGLARRGPQDQLWIVPDYTRFGNLNDFEKGVLYEPYPNGVLTDHSEFQVAFKEAMEVAFKYKEIYDEEKSAMPRKVMINNAW